MSTDTLALQRGLIDTLKAEGSLRSERVEDAFLAVPRHLFLRHLIPEQVYLDENIPTKHSESGEVISSASQPSVVADILEQLDLQPGQKILEIGAGTGYNAALLAHLVGKEGHVVSLDIDEDIVLGARDNLAHVGVANVRVERADGHYGFEASAPYDRIVMSTSSPDVFPAWVKQLKEGGRLGFAVRFFAEERGGTFVVFEKRKDNLLSCAGANANFMPMRGEVVEKTEGQSDQGEKALHEWIAQGKRFSRILVYPNGTELPAYDNQIVINRVHSALAFQWD